MSPLYWMPMLPGRPIVTPSINSVLGGDPNMNYYGYTFDRESALQHHGILGQKWGVRRFQNKDGSLTNAGKSRYQRGKDYQKEKHDLYTQEHKRLQSSSKAYQKAAKEADYLLNKYGLDADDGGGGDSTRYSEKELEWAGQRYWDRAETMAIMDEEFEKKAREYAHDTILKKYGPTAISDMKFTQNVQNAEAVATLVAALGGIAWISSKV